MSDGITLHNPCHYPIDADRLRGAAKATLVGHAGNRQDSLAIALTDGRTIRSMNARYARIDAPTDALSFPADAAQPTADEAERYLGDIVIAYDYVRDQARSAQVALDDALCLLVIHGTLHLLGYDHDTSEERDKMWAAQARALRRIRIDPGVLERYAGIDNE